jgi:putative PIG3 family NAD(P)H quinone oxidoreductase
MHAVAITKPGGPEVLEVVERATPQARRGEVLLKVIAAGVNRPDCLQRAGIYPPPPDASDLPGLEVSGVVAQLGEGATGWSVGDRVCALVPGGGYAEFCVAPAAHCLPVPEGLGMEEAASLPETFFTVWINVFERARLQRGESLLVQGGSGGIGVTAIQLGRAFGGRVFATAGGAEKCRRCVELGAERCIDYRTEDFVEVVRELTGGKGVDVILDIVGGDYVPRELSCLATDGRLSLIGFQGGREATLNLTDLLMRRLTLTGSTLRPRSSEYKAQVAEALRNEVWPLFANYTLRPVIFKVLPLSKAAQSHVLMESGAHTGKMVLAVAD